MSKKEIQIAISLFEAIDDVNISNLIALLEKYNANPNIVIPKLGITPFHYASGFDDINFSEAVIDLFLKKDADPNIFTECDSKLTALHIACIWNRPKIVRMLLENGADLNLKCNEGRTAVDYAIIQQNFNVVEVIQKFVFEQKIEKKKLEIFEAQRISKDYDDCTPQKSSMVNVLQNIEKKKFTPNRINYNFDATSPYYINITHRRHQTSHKTIEIENNEENEKKVEALNLSEQGYGEDEFNEKKNLFELTRKNLKEFSKQINKAIVIDRIAIHKRKSYIFEWRDKIQHYFDENEKFEISSISRINPESLTIDISSSTDSFETSKGTNASIQKPTVEDQEFEENVIEHLDNVSGIKLIERNIKNLSSNELFESSLSTIISIPPLDYDTDMLKEELKKFGRNPIITKSTKRLHLKQLMKLKKHPEQLGVVEGGSSQSTYPLELQRTITSYDYLIQNIKSFLALETKMVSYFLEKNHLKWREGNAKTSFVYLLLDPRVSDNLSVCYTQMEKSKVWEKFLKSIFYVGKGKRSRPYQHLYDAIKFFTNRTRVKFQNIESKKLSRIVDIWKENYGVVCLHIFHNIMPCEAFSREAAIIETMGLESLTNAKKGEFYGAATCFTMRQKRQLGIALLYRALNIYLAEGESQLKPEDLKIIPSNYLIE